MVRGRDWDIRWLFLDRCRTRWLRRPPPTTVSTPVSVKPTAPQPTPRRPPLSRTDLHAHLVRCQNHILDRLLLCSAPGVVAEPCRLRLRRCVLRHRDQMVPLPVACVRRVRLRTAADIRGLCRTQALDLQLGHSSYATPPCRDKPLLRASSRARHLAAGCHPASRRPRHRSGDARHRQRLYSRRLAACDRKL